MKYPGSKRLVARHFMPLILFNRKPGQVYVEPFLGGANSFNYVDGEKIGYDINKYLVAYLTKIRDGWLPPKNELTEKEYEKIKQNKNDYPDEIVFWAGALCSFKSIWFAGLAKHKERNFVLETYNNAKKQKKYLENSKIYCCDYRNAYIPPNSIIYCDPPYKNTRYLYKKDEHEKFDYNFFYNWCRQKSFEKNLVFITELEMPNDFVCVNQWYTRTYIAYKDRPLKLEKLFIPKGQKILK